MKRTLVVTHVMPLELEMFERFITYYKEGFKYLDENDDVTMYVTLNLNPKLTDWDSSELKPQWFIDKFTKAMQGVRSYIQIVIDDSIWGTTQQKYEVIKLDYDQFIFVDPDISIHPQQLKMQLIAAEQLSGPFVLSPNIPRWWDSSWDVLVHPDFKNAELGQFKLKETFKNTFTQNPKEVGLKLINQFKFGCGMHTLYSKEFWNLIGIPKEFGGYGSEDTFAMVASGIAKQFGIDVRQYVLDGLYITEDKDEEHRDPSYKHKIKVFDIKRDGKKYSNEIMGDILQKFKENLLNKSK
jgi:hypothetical protein